MTVTILHLNQPLAHAQHYIGFTDDLIGRIIEHKETRWKPLPQPATTADGRIVTGTKHGHGATFMGAVNFHQIQFRLARTWDEVDRSFERRLHNYKNSKFLCPICNPKNALNLMLHTE